MRVLFCDAIYLTTSNFSQIQYYISFWEAQGNKARNHEKQFRFCEEKEVMEKLCNEFQFMFCSIRKFMSMETSNYDFIKKFHFDLKLITWSVQILSSVWHIFVILDIHMKVTKLCHRKLSLVLNSNEKQIDGELHFFLEKFLYVKVFS